MCDVPLNGKMIDNRQRKKPGVGNTVIIIIR